MLDRKRIARRDLRPDAFARASPRSKTVTRDADPLMRSRLVAANSRFTRFIPFSDSFAGNYRVVIARRSGAISDGTLGFKIVAGGVNGHGKKIEMFFKAASMDLDRGSVALTLITPSENEQCRRGEASFICVIGWLRENIAAARTYRVNSLPRVPSYPFLLPFAFLIGPFARKGGVHRWGNYAREN